MIHQNMKLGETDNMTVLQFGTGDIGIVEALNKENTSLVMFSNIRPRKIGSKILIKAKTLDDLKPQVIMIFDSIESIDTVMRSLRRAKKRLKDLPKDQ
jgi:hypothetical protein